MSVRIRGEVEYKVILVIICKEFCHKPSQSMIRSTQPHMKIVLLYLLFSVVQMKKKKIANSTDGKPKVF